MTWVDFSIRLGVALFLGGVIGIERQWRQTRAVLKTNALVSIGAALFVMNSLMTPGDSSPTRVAAQIVSGVGFLGGGIILREGASISGLNTAATLWCSAAVGTLAGSGAMFQAYLGAFAVVLTNLALRPLVEQIKGGPGSRTPSFHSATIQRGKPKEPAGYRCVILCYSKDELKIRNLLLEIINQDSLLLNALQSRDIGGPTETGITEIQVDVMMVKRDDQLIEQFVELIKLEGQVNTVSWEVLSPTQRPG
jgi:putative Mg2+ transporter-C (MgtC) family protein